MNNSNIIWTLTDEAPALASYSLLPIFKAFGKRANVSIQASDISLAGRVIALFSDRLENYQVIDDELSRLGELSNTSDANIIKLPNISASVPQLKDCIKELQNKNYNIPDFIENPISQEDKENQRKYKNVLGSAVNPVLREGNSDRRAPSSVKNYTKKFPHSMGEWKSSSKSHVATMSSGDFRANEISCTLNNDTIATISFIDKNGNKTILRDNISLLRGDIIDATYMSIKSLNKFLEEQITDAKEKNVLFSLHLKATMMKVSDPIMFGHCVKIYYKDAISKHTQTIKELEINFNNGLGDLYSKITKLDKAKREQIISDFDDIYNHRADIAMVDSDKAITNLHIPSSVIVDASMAATIRNGGKMWDKDGEERDTKFTIPDSSYAPLYDESIKDCIANGSLDPTSLGTVQNVGLMAKKAQEYGSHNYTFEAIDDGAITISDDNGNIIHSLNVECGDIYRMTRVQDAPISNWVGLAVARAKETKYKTIFWLDDDRAHTIEMIKKVNTYLREYDISDLDIEIMSTRDASRVSIERMRRGENTISVTGNVLRDYNTDLYPILELGTSAKMLSIVPLMNGGGLYETGAGGSAPKLVEQLEQHNFLRWDSLGEFLAIAPSLHQVGKEGNKQAEILSTAIEKATQNVLDNQKLPKPKPRNIDNRGSHFYLAFYWAKELSLQTSDKALADYFKSIFEQLQENEDAILKEFLDEQDKPVDFGGYYKLDDEKISKIMRPSKILNSIIGSM